MVVSANSLPHLIAHTCKNIYKYDVVKKGAQLLEKDVYKITNSILGQVISREQEREELISNLKLSEDAKSTNRIEVLCSLFS